VLRVEQVARMKVVKVCPECGNSDIAMDIVVVWNVIAHQLVFQSGNFTDGGCYECQAYFTDAEDKEID
jgi:hypothetical protein